MERPEPTPTYRLRFVIVATSLVVACVALGLLQFGDPHSGMDWLTVIVLGALVVGSAAEGWWRWRRHFPLFPRRPGD